MTDAPLPEADTHQYLVGDLTFKHVFQAAKLVNMSDMQAVLDAVENALAASSNPEPMPAKDDSDDVVLSNGERAVVPSDDLGVVHDDAAQHRSLAAAHAIRSAFFTTVSGERRHSYCLSLAYPTMDAMHEAEDAIKAWAKSILEPGAATKRTTPEERDAWMGDPLSLDAGLPQHGPTQEDMKAIWRMVPPATPQEGDACVCGGTYTMCADGHAVNCPASNQLAAYERMTAAQTVRDIAVKTEATRLMFEQIHREGGRDVAGHRVTADMAIMATGVLETVCKELAAALVQVEAK